MKKVVSAILAAVMLLALTGCKKEVIPDFGDQDESLNAVYNNVCNSFQDYFPSYDYPTEDGLPLVGNTGAVSLKDQFAEDERFRPLLEEFVEESNFQKRRGITEKILQILCGVEDIPEENDFFSKRELIILRKLWSKDQEIAAEEVPEPQGEFYNRQAQSLSLAYWHLLNKYTLSLICSLAYGNISYIRKYTDSEGGEYPYMGYFNRHLCYSLELGEMSEREFCDSVVAIAVCDQINPGSLRMLAEFYAYVEKQAMPAYGDAPKKCLELTEKTVRELDEMRVLKDVHLFLGDDDDENIGGWDNGSNLLMCGKGNDTLEGGKNNDFLIGGEGDDIYLIQAGDGCDTIFDCGGHNLIRFEKVSNVYAVGFSEDDLKDDVKLCFGGEFVVVKDFLANRSVLFDVEINGQRIAYDSSQNPLSDIHEPGYVPNTAAPPVG